MGAIPEAFRTFPGTLRSMHPLVSVCANGPLAASITAEHALEFCESRGTPFEKLYTLGAHTLLLGVGSTDARRYTTPSRWFQEDEP